MVSRASPFNIGQVDPKDCIGYTLLNVNVVFQSDAMARIAALRLSKVFVFFPLIVPRRNRRRHINHQGGSMAGQKPVGQVLLANTVKTELWTRRDDFELPIEYPPVGSGSSAFSTADSGVVSTSR